MMAKGHSYRGLFGGIKHYEDGKYIGSSFPDLLEDYTHYDAKGKKIGRSISRFQHIEHYNSSGKRIGTTYHGLFGDKHYDAGGKHLGTRYRDIGSGMRFCEKTTSSGISFFDLLLEKDEDEYDLFDG